MLKCRPQSHPCRYIYIYISWPLSRFTAAVLEKAKPLVEAVKQKNKELEQDTVAKPGSV